MSSIAGGNLPCVSFEKSLLPIISELGIFYVPKQMDPGPAIIFPQRDISGRVSHGKIWPLYPLILHDKPVKYSNLGDKDLVQGPNWFGNTDPTLALAMQTRTVFLVEGFFDLLACRLMWPSTPVLSNGTKSISDDHILYLRLLGVKHIRLAFDNEAPKGDRRSGQGTRRCVSLRASTPAIPQLRKSAPSSALTMTPPSVWRVSDPRRSSERCCPGFSQTGARKFPPEEYYPFEERLSPGNGAFTRG